MSQPRSRRTEHGHDRDEGRRRARCGRSATTTASPTRPSGSSGRCSSRRAGITAGQRVLDVAAGTGNVAIRAAEAGARGRRFGPDAGELRRRPPRGARARGRARVGRGRRRGRCRSTTASSTSSRPRSARCSPPTTSAVADELAARVPARGHDRDAQLHARGPGRRLLRHARALLPPPPPGRCRRCCGGSEDHVRELFGDRVDSLEMTRESTPSGPRARSPTSSSSTRPSGPWSPPRRARRRAGPRRCARPGLPGVRDAREPRRPRRPGRIPLRVPARHCPQAADVEKILPSSANHPRGLEPAPRFGGRPRG